MSAWGQKQTSAHVRVMSALPPKADIAERQSFDHLSGAHTPFSRANSLFVEPIVRDRARLRTSFEKTPMGIFLSPGETGYALIWSDEACRRARISAKIANFFPREGGEVSKSKSFSWAIHKHPLTTCALSIGQSSGSSRRFATRARRLRVFKERGRAYVIFNHPPNAID
jgi:hypothetical protein